jgi:hypothetical protein
LGSKTFSESPNFAGVAWIKKFADVSVRVSKITATVTTSAAAGVNFAYGNSPDTFNRLEYGLGSTVTAANVPMSKSITNNGDGKGMYICAWATPSTSVLKSIVITVDYDDPAPLAGTLRVTVNSTAIVRISGATVTCSPVSAGESSSKITNGSGETSFSVPIDRTITITAAKSGFQSSSNTIPALTEAGQVYTTGITLQEYVVPPTVPTPEPTPTAQDSRISVYVKDTSGNPISNAMVVLNGTTLYQGTTGYVTFNFMLDANKSVTFTASKAGYVSKSATVTVVKGQYGSTQIYLEQSVSPPTYHSLTVYVKDSTGAGIQNVTVSVDDIGRTSGSDGTAFFASLLDGTHIISARKEPFEPVTTTVTIVSDATLTITMGLRYGVSPALQTFATQNGIPLDDIPVSPIVCNDIIVIEFASEPDSRLTDVDILVMLSERISADYPDVHILGLKKYGRKVAIFVKGSPLAALIVVGVVAVLLSIFAITLPAIISWCNLDTKRQIIQASGDQINAILADTTLTAEQKEALIRQILQTGQTAVTEPAGALGQIGNIVTIAVIGGILYLIISKTGGKKGGK